MPIQRYIGVVVITGGLVLVTKLPGNWIFIVPVMVVIGVLALVLDKNKE